MTYSPRYVTLSQLKHHLRYEDHDDSNDSILLMYLAAAEQAVDNYITTDISDDEGAKAVVKTAVLMLVGYYDDNRTPNKDTVVNGDYTLNNYLPSPVQTILFCYRKPTAI